ncbi:MAG: hypothetical protein ABFD92_10565 [Planctomycetaceae bacterium]|nr:hypothetical protein [Planctomycetaceae bacterium]
MARQWVTISVIGGRTGQEIARRFERWITVAKPIPKAKQDDPRALPWKGQQQRQMDDLAERLERVGNEPPVLFYCKYSDMWGPQLKLPLTSRKILHVWNRTHELWCYPLPDGRRLERALCKALRSRRVARGCLEQELRWYYRLLYEAVDAWSEIYDYATLVLIRHITGGFVSDDDVRQSLGRQILRSKAR